MSASVSSVSTAMEWPKPDVLFIYEFRPALSDQGGLEELGQWQRWMATALLDIEPGLGRNGCLGVNNVMALAPIALFVYNRPKHTLRTVESLRKNVLANGSDLFIFSDGPKYPSQSGLINSGKEIYSWYNWV